MTGPLHTTRFPEYFKPTFEIYWSEKKILFKVGLPVDNGPPRALMERYSEVFAVFMPANTTSILRPMTQGVILNFKSYYLRNMFYKGTAAINSDSSYGSKQIKLKTFWKEFTILYAMKNICDSWEEVKISILIGVWKKSVLTLSDDIEGFKISVEEVTSNMIEIA